MICKRGNPRPGLFDSLVGRSAVKAADQAAEALSRAVDGRSPTGVCSTRFVGRSAVKAADQVALWDSAKTSLRTRPLRDCISYYNGDGTAEPGSLAYYGGPQKWHALRAEAQLSLSPYVFRSAPD